MNIAKQAGSVLKSAYDLCMKGKQISGTVSQACVMGAVAAAYLISQFDYEDEDMLVDEVE